MSGHGFHPFKGRVSRHFADTHLSPDDAYLSYYDVRLTKEDYDCIKDDWLTDNVIAFYEEYLEHDLLPHYPAASITLLRPSMTFMLIQTPDPRTLLTALPSFDRITHIFLPINDNRSVTTAEGGTHWSLLLVSLIDGVGFHYDSLSPSNSGVAEHATYKLSQLLGKPLKFADMRSSPQQENGSDCGVFVILVMKYLLRERLLLSNREAKVGMGLEGVRMDAGRGRKDVLRKIDGFREVGRRSMSGSRERSPGLWGRKSESESRSPPRVGD